METIKKEGMAKKTFWGAFLFYFLIAFEFFYMASPFAVYFYSIYRPALDFFNASPALAWLISFFMPHAVIETSSVFINLHNIVGGILAVLGFLGFCIGAFQIYYYKLAKKGAVTGGIYNFIRHPQYACFIICSFGLLILWPRYIVLIMYITMLFVYYLLAKAEEKECEAKFGEAYRVYKQKTHMFIPFQLPFSFRIPVMPKSKGAKLSAVLGLYVMTLTLGVFIAKGINSLAINSLYSIYDNHSATLSISKNDPKQLEKIIQIALSSEEVRKKVENKRYSGAKYLNYVLPSEWYVAEIPMNGRDQSEASANRIFRNESSRRIGHWVPSDYNKDYYKIIFTKAEIRGGREVSGKDILLNVYRREPLIEVWVDINKNKIIKIMEMPEEIMYDNIPVAIY